MRFKEFLTEGDFNYLSVGHEGNNIDSYVLPTESDDIILASDKNEDPNDFHHGYWRKYGKSFFKYSLTGRIDHDKKTISIGCSNYQGNEDRIKYLIRLLKLRFPGYKIFSFYNCSQIVKQHESKIIAP